MTSLRSWFVSGAVLAMAAAASPAQAQDSKFTASVNFGFQAGSGDISQSLQPIIYDEAAKVDVSQTYENGPLVDLGGSYMLFGKWGVGVAYNHTSGDGNATIAAEIPDPKVFDNPRAVSLSAAGLKHNEDAVHVDIFPGQQHTFQMAAGRSPVADEAVARIGGWLRSRLEIADR